MLSRPIFNHDGYRIGVRRQNSEHKFRLQSRPSSPSNRNSGSSAEIHYIVSSGSARDISVEDLGLAVEGVSYSGILCSNNRLFLATWH